MRDYKVTVNGFCSYSKTFTVGAKNKKVAKSAARAMASADPDSYPGRFVVSNCVRA